MLVSGSAVRSLARALKEYMYLLSSLSVLSVSILLKRCPSWYQRSKMVYGVFVVDESHCRTLQHVRREPHFFPIKSILQ